MLFFILTAIQKFMTALKPLLNSEVCFSHLGVPVAVELPKIFQYILFGVIFPNAVKMKFFKKKKKRKTDRQKVVVRTGRDDFIQVE